MRRTTVSIGDPALRDLQRMAQERGVSVAALIREAIQDKLATFRPRPRSLGVGASGHTDTARRSGDGRPEPRSWR